MDRAELNKAKSLLYRDPALTLRELRTIEATTADLDLRPEVRHLRTNDLKQVRELRQAALFCYGMSSRMGLEVRFSPTEASDYDFIATWASDEYRHFAPVQLKELVPETLNPHSTIQNLVDGLSKYSSSQDLTVAVFLNRNGTFTPSELRIPILSIAALWFVSCVSPDQSKWRLIGNFIEMPDTTDFMYPVEQ